jgi:hypothetical protein
MPFDLHMRSTSAPVARPRRLYESASHSEAGSVRTNSGLRPARYVQYQASTAVVRPRTMIQIVSQSFMYYLLLSLNFEHTLCNRGHPREPGHPLLPPVSGQQGASACLGYWIRVGSWHIIGTASYLSPQLRRARRLLRLLLGVCPPVSPPLPRGRFVHVHGPCGWENTRPPTGCQPPAAVPVEPHACGSRFLTLLRAPAAFPARPLPPEPPGLAPEHARNWWLSLGIPWLYRNRWLSLVISPVLCSTAQHHIIVRQQLAHSHGPHMDADARGGDSARGDSRTCTCAHCPESATPAARAVRVLWL